MIRHLALFGVGILFAVGLGIAGMTRPDRIIGFLRFTGNWDPTLMFVMMGAIASYVAVFRLAMRRSSPVFAPKFMIPTRRDLDVRLIGGAALFGVGWGLAGYCPAPALTALPTGGAAAFVFVATLLTGMWAFKRFDGWASSRKEGRRVSSSPRPTLESRAA